MPTVLAEPTKEQALELATLRALNYDWSVLLRGVWSDPKYDAPEIHTELRDEFAEELTSLKADETNTSPLGWLVVGPGGSGKTHWLASCRQQAVARNYGFILVDMTDVRSFWGTVLQGFIDSLQQEYRDGKFQQQILLEKFLGTLPMKVSVAEAMHKIAAYPGETLAGQIGKMVEIIRRKHPQETLQHHDIIRALLAMTSHDASIAAAGLNWLNAGHVDEESRRLLGFTKAQEEPQRIIKALSWLMSLCGPTVVAFDQLDPIVQQLDPAAQSARDLDAQGQAALSIISEIANGLGAMREYTYDTLTVVSCLEITLKTLRKYTLKTWQDRFQEPRILNALQSATAATAMLYPRIAAACEKTGFQLPYSTWPITPAALSQIAGQTPRELLQLCDAHRRRCLREKRVFELESLNSNEKPPAPPKLDLSGIDSLFERYRGAAKPCDFADEKLEDELLGPLLLAGCGCLLKEYDWTKGLDAVVDNFPGGKTTKPLHARVRLIDHAQHDRETHYSFRALERSNAQAFQSRLKGVVNGSGIDARLPFRHALILRARAIPGGSLTQQLWQEYCDRGGKLHPTTDDDLRTLSALCQLAKERPEGWEEWLLARKPASKLALFQQAVSGILRALNGGGSDEQGSPVPAPPATSPANGQATSTVTLNPTPKKTSEPSPPNKPAPQHKTAAEPESRNNSEKNPATSVQQETKAHQPNSLPKSADVHLGLRRIGTQETPIRIPFQLLEKHTVILAGAGSGKTVLLKHLVEEAALAGIPSIVLDAGNDLLQLALPRTDVPQEWRPEDPARAAHFREHADVMPWTPGRESGNPLIFEPLPDLAAVKDDPEELRLTIDAAVDALAAWAIPDRAQKAQNKRAILSSSLRYFAGHGAGNLRDFVEILAELPPEAGLKIQKEDKLAREMADSLRGKLEIDPLLRGSGTGLDPAVLFGDAKPFGSKTRVSVISFIGLPSRESRQQFVYQLGMNLFAWIKKNPIPKGRGLRGLLIVDEAKDLVPSQRSCASKIALQLLAAQARKYHLGVVLATQNPKEIENTVIGNCSTHFYGRANSPTALESIQDQLRARGGQGNDIAQLTRGQFYAYNSEAGMPQPVKLLTPLCLSQHGSPLEEDEILRLAKAGRARLENAK